MGSQLRGVSENQNMILRIMNQLYPFFAGHPAFDPINGTGKERDNPTKNSDC